jgi:hypothetical protein
MRAIWPTAAGARAVLLMAECAGTGGTRGPLPGRAGRPLPAGKQPVRARGARIGACRSCGAAGRPAAAG